MVKSRLHQQKMFLQGSIRDEYSHSLLFAKKNLLRPWIITMKQCPGLGYEFATEVRRAFDRIKVFPAAWPLFSKSTRRCLLNRFPYGVLYRVDRNAIRVGAIMHLDRDPKNWYLRSGKF